MSEPEASPPVAARHEVVRDLHGVRRVDGYHWLSDRSSPATTDYLAAERAFYESSTGHLEPLRTELFREMRRRVLPTDESVSWRRGGYVYSTRTVEGRDYTQLLRCKADVTVDSAPIVLLDENELAGGSAYFATGLVEPSPDGRLVAYSVDLTGTRSIACAFVMSKPDRTSVTRSRAPTTAERGQPTRGPSSTRSTTPHTGPIRCGGTCWAARRQRTGSSCRR